MKIFRGGLRMKWSTVILFAVIAGIYTGAVMLLPFLKNTSFQDIGISYEWWVVFAVVIVVNCEKSLEAALKCFVFFLISQPLVYLVEVVFGSLSLELAMLYYLTIWLPATLLTLPGGFIAWFCQKQTVPGAVVLALGNTIELILGVWYLKEAIQSFPHHLLSALFCFASVIVMSFGIQRETKKRLIAILLAVVLTIAVAVAARLAGLSFI